MLLKEKAELFLDMIKGGLLICHLISLAHCRARIIDEFSFLLFTSSSLSNICYSLATRESRDETLCDTASQLVGGREFIEIMHIS